MTKVSVGGLIIAVCIFGLQSCRHGTTPTSQSPHSGQPAPTTEIQPDRSIENAQLVSRERNEEDAAQKISIETAYPQLIASADSSAQVFNSTMSDYVTERIETFKKDIKEASKDAQPAAGAGRQGGSIDISYRIPYSKNGLISVLFDTSIYTGGAHPSGTSRAFNYDLKRGRMLTLDDLFIPREDHLKVIADYCINTMKRRKVGDEESIREGAAARKKNYTCWNITPEGLLITFDAYQVASYAEGPQEVVVPYSVLKGIIRPDGPLASLVK